MDEKSVRDFAVSVTTHRWDLELGAAVTSKVFKALAEGGAPLGDGRHFDLMFVRDVATTDDEGLTRKVTMQFSSCEREIEPGSEAEEG